MIYEILHKFSAQEYDFFLSRTGTGTHTRKISAMIRKGQGEIGKDEMFKRVFKKKREPQNDYLLRNELSILKRKLELFIIENTPVDLPVFVSYYKPYAMAQWCLQNALVKPAEKYLARASSIAREHEAWQGLLKINRCRLQLTQYSKSDYHQKQGHLQSLADEHLDYLKEYIAEEVRYADFIRAGAFKLAAHLRKTNHSFELTHSFNIEPDTSKSMVARFYYYKSLAYTSSGTEAIGLLKKALSFLDSDLEMFLKEEEKLACMSAMAMEYAIIGDLNEAEEVFGSILSHPGFDHFHARNSLLFNYCTTLLKLKKYKKAIGYIELLESLDIEPIVLERIYTMKCNCYIFLGDLKNLKKILPRNLQSYDLAVRSYYRFLYVIYYLIKGEYDLAERELENTRSMKDFSDTGYMPLLKIFDKYIEAWNARFYKEKKEKEKMLLLRSELHLFLNNHVEVSQLLPGTWIIEQSHLLLEE
jgi:hypothetical protein